MPLVPMGAGRGRSTPPHVAPPSKEKYPRIGRRKISFDPAARFDGFEGLIVMNVSLCGPHSFETSTFAPTASEEIPPGLGSEPFFSRNWYLSHQVGSFRIESARAAGKAPTANIRSAETILEFMKTSWVLGRDDGVRLAGDLLEPHGRELALRAARDQDGRDDGQDQADAENEPFDDRLLAVSRGGERRLAAGGPGRDVDRDHRDDPGG